MVYAYEDYLENDIDYSKRYAPTAYFTASECITPTISGATSVLGQKNLENTISNCKYYASANAGYKCIRCDFGYHGVVEFDGIDNYIRSCNPMADCDTTVKYQS